MNRLAVSSQVAMATTKADRTMVPINKHMHFAQQLREREGDDKWDEQSWPPSDKLGLAWSPGVVLMHSLRNFILRRQKHKGLLPRRQPVLEDIYLMHPPNPTTMKLDYTYGHRSRRLAAPAHPTTPPQHFSGVVLCRGIHRPQDS